MGHDRYNVCTQPRCRNPVSVTLESRRCGKHGGETLPVWAVYHDDHGWLTDTGVGGSYSFDVDDAEWFFDTDSTVETLVACDLLVDVEGPLKVKTEVTCRFGPFLIVLIK